MDTNVNWESGLHRNALLKSYALTISGTRLILFTGCLNPKEISSPSLPRVPRGCESLLRMRV